MTQTIVVDSIAGTGVGEGEVDWNEIRFGPEAPPTKPDTEPSAPPRPAEPIEPLDPPTDPQPQRVPKTAPGVEPETCSM